MPQTVRVGATQERGDDQLRRNHDPSLCRPSTEYSDARAAAFAGATYDPTSHYRGAAVFEFHQQQELTPERLRQINRGQVALLATTFEGLDIDPAIAHVEPMSAERRGGFLAIRAPRAVEIVRALRKRSVYADARGEILRLGPARCTCVTIKCAMPCSRLVTSWRRRTSCQAALYCVWTGRFHFACHLERIPARSTS